MEKSVKDDHVGQIPAPCNAVTDDKFPEGMRVLAVDDDNTCLRKLEGILRKCRYNATVTTEATTALKLLREKKNGFDIVLTDVQMPEMDGFRLLEIISLEMDIPVIMISGYDDKNMIMKGIKHGARDYLLKPIRMEEIKNIWQHVVRKHLVGSNGLSIVAKRRETDQNSKTFKRHRDQSKDKETETSSSSDGDYLNQKKPRVTWSPELHAKFCDAVHKLGVDKAVPKRILELMDEQGLTRENVASHLQKFRNALKKTSARKGQQNNTEFDSNGMGGYLPNSTFSSFEDKGHDSINSLDGFRPTSYGNSDMIQYGNHIRNPDSFSISFGNPKPLLLPSNQQDILLQRYMKAPRVLDQMQQRMQIPGFGDVPLNPLRMENLHHQSDFNMQKYETVPSELDDFMEISSHFHSYNASTEIGPSGSPLLGCGSISQHNGTFLNVTGSPFTMLGNASTELSAITQPDSVIGEVQNSLPGRQDGRNLVAYSGRGELEFSGQATGVQLHMNSSNVEHFTRNDQMKLDHHPLEHLETESIFHLSSCSYTDYDLNAAIKQFQQ